MFFCVTLIILRNAEFLWTHLCFGQSFILSSCDHAVEQLFCYSVMNMAVIKISLKFCNEYSVYMCASHCDEHVTFGSIFGATLLWL